MKIQLIFANDSASITHNFPEKPVPVFLFILANYLSQRDPSLKIEIYDGNYINLFKGVNLFDGDLIGFSDWFSNHEESIRSTRLIKGNNPSVTIVYGGPNASNLGKLLLENHDEIDFLVIGDGEQALYQLVNGNSPEKISNLVFRKGNKIQQNKFKPVNLSICNELKLNGYISDNTKYIEKISLFPVSLLRGCVKALRKGKCLYCCLPFNNQIRVMQPRLAWEQLIYLWKTYGFGYFFETSDNFIFSERFLENFLRHKPKLDNLPIKIRINTDIHSLLSLNNIDVLKKIGITSVFIGIESINRRILEKNRNMVHTKDQIYSVMHRLQDQQIKVFPTFLFGLMGEDKRSVKENSEFVHILIDKFRNIEDILVDFVLPVAGSQIFNILCQDKRVIEEYRSVTRKNLLYDDFIDYTALSRIYLKYYTEVDEYLISAEINEIQRAFKLKDVSKFGGLRW